MTPEEIQEHRNFRQSLKVCAFIAKPIGLEVKFVNIISSLVDELTGLKPEDQQPCIDKIKKVLYNPNMGRLLHMQFAVPALQKALNAGGIIFCKFWQSCLNGLPNEKFTYNLNK